MARGPSDTRTKMNLDEIGKDEIGKDEVVKDQLGEDEMARGRNGKGRSGNNSYIPNIYYIITSILKAIITNGKCLFVLF